jgi:hypothetical protein
MRERLNLPGLYRKKKKAVASGSVTICLAENAYSIF